MGAVSRPRCRMENRDQEIFRHWVSRLCGLLWERSPQTAIVGIIEDRDQEIAPTGGSHTPLRTSQSFRSAESPAQHFLWLIFVQLRLRSYPEPAHSTQHLIGRRSHVIRERQRRTQKLGHHQANHLFSRIHPEKRAGSTCPAQFTDIREL